ncbi:MAG: branched-chain amino acid ABC transporter permease [Desulfomicrobium sp.]|nr:branched-chain amino acid ABC transporter permease [Desulfomicrobium sp.]
MTRQQKLFYFLSLHRTGLLVLCVSIGLLLFPLVENNPYTLGLTNLVAINALVVLGLNLFIGYAGQISLGHAAFFGLGAYGSAIATTTFHCSPWLAMILVAVCVALLALLIGIPLLRLSGHYLAMATLGLNYVVHNILLQWDEVTGGPSGFAGIPALTLGNFSLDTPIRRHYLLWCFVIITMLFCLNLVRSSAGRSLAALAGDELAAASLGVNIQVSKVKIFVLSAILASLAGSLFAHTFGYISPDTFNIFASVQFSIMVVIGGMGSIWGSLFGAGFLTLLPQWMDVFDTYKDFIHGGILVLVLMFLPQGLISGLTDKLRIYLALRRRNAAT